MPYKLLLAVLIYFPVFAKTQNKKIEDKIIDSIFSLKEVKEKMDYVEKATKGKRHLGVVIAAEPSRDQPYYWVKVWEDNGYMFVTHLNFYVYPKTLTIKYLDVSKDTAISLKRWRYELKHNKNAHYQKPDKPSHKWYHLTHITLKGDSVSVYQNPIYIVNRDTVWSASDGAFYYYKGKLTCSEDEIKFYLRMTKCDYCGIPADSAYREKWQHKVMTGRLTAKGILIKNHFFRKTEKDKG